jgi:uncharacterized membrane protein required for colicin V production
MTQSIFDILYIGFGICVALFTYTYLAFVLYTYLRLPAGWGYLVGFASIAVLIDVGLAIATSHPRKRFEKSIWTSKRSDIDRVLGPIPHLILGMTVLALLLALLVTYPVSNSLKDNINKSILGSALARSASTLLRH